MASKVIVRLEDDLDGSEADETIKFALDGTEYEIDLSEQNASSMRKALGNYVSHARKVGGRTRKATTGTAPDLKAVRAWAASNGIELSTRGRIPGTVLEQYRAAGN